MNALNNFDKTDREYSIAPTDDPIRFWIQGQGHSRPWRWWRHPHCCWGVEVQLLIIADLRTAPAAYVRPVMGALLMYCDSLIRSNRVILSKAKNGRTYVQKRSK